jgi:tetratricopeptide (TPR) repeat protein
VAIERQRKPAEALTIYECALTLRPDDPVAHYNVGRVSFLLDRLDRAKTHLERALALKPDFLAAWNNLGNALRKEGKPLEALACLEQALAIDLDDRGTHLNLGATLRELHLADKDAASAQAARLLTLHGHRPLIWRVLTGFAGAG